MIRNKSHPTFEYCALKYMLQWYAKERPLYKSMSGNEIPFKAISNTLYYFQVARSFKGLGKEESKQKKIRKLVLKHSNNLSTQIDAKRNVQSLANDIKKVFEKKNISAASKLLWIRRRSPVILFDRRTSKALKMLYPDFKGNHYEEFYKQWRISYEEHKNSVKEATKKLERVINIITPHHIPKEKAIKEVRGGWFQERVFDIYLWELGQK